MTTRPSCLLLDEPTSQLDDDAIEVVAAFLRDLPGVVVRRGVPRAPTQWRGQALGTTPGTVVVASYDRWLRRRWEGNEVSLGG